MTKKDLDFSKTVIYKIICKDLVITECYVGRTTDIIRRRSAHKASCMNNKNTSYNVKLYQFIREHGNWINWSLVEIEKVNCNSLEEASIKERYWYDLLKPTLNNNIPCQKPNISREAYRMHNMEKHALFARNYYHKRCLSDPEYKNKQCEKQKRNKRNRDMKNKKEGDSIENQRGGRPLKYPINTD